MLSRHRSPRAKLLVRRAQAAGVGLPDLVATSAEGEVRLSADGQKAAATAYEKLRGTNGANGEDKKSTAASAGKPQIITLKY